MRNELNTVVFENDERMMELVRELTRNRNLEIVIITSASGQKIMDEALEYKEDHVLENIDFSEELECRVTKLFQLIGIPAHVKGYYYLREAILLAINNAGILEMITKGLYPEIAKKYHSTPSRVERAMRNAIEIAWNRGAVDVLDDLFGCTISPERGRPSNSEFIAWVADRIYLEYKKR